MVAGSLAGCTTAPLDAVVGGRSSTYASSDDVFLSGGPDDALAELADGTYFFAVLAPGSQGADFLDDRDAADPLGNRTFTVENHEIVAYAGTHATGETADGRFAIALAPFDSSPDGAYIVAICAAGATEPAQCTYDAFRIRSDAAGQPAAPLAHGGAFYDADLDGVWDAGEPGLPGWTIDYHHMISSTVATGADGRFALELIPDGYLVVARDAQPDVWQSTGAVRDMTTAGGGAIASRNDDASYWIEIADDQTVHGLVFGRVCIGPDGAVQATPATCPPPTFAAVR